MAGVELDHPDTELFGEKIMGKTEPEIVNLMEKNGNTDSEEDVEDNVGESHSDRRLSYDESMMDFFFRDNQLVYMNFGVFVDNEGNIEKV